MIPSLKLTGNTNKISDFFKFSFTVHLLKPFSLTPYAQIIALFVNLVFLGQAFTIMLVYIWSRRNPYVRMNFFGLLTFKAPFLPWVLFGFSLMLGNSVMVDLIGNSI